MNLKWHKNVCRDLNRNVLIFDTRLFPEYLTSLQPASMTIEVALLYF